MRPRRVAIIGFGRLGRACADAIALDDQLVLAGIVRRAETVMEPLPTPFTIVPAVTHISEIGNVDAALVCVPLEQVRATARELLQQGIPVVECARFEGEDLSEHKREIAHLASRFEVPAIVGAGWDPGAMSLFRHLFALLTPKGHTEISHRPGSNLHHTTVARGVPGVKDALCTEVRAMGGKRQRYVYIELEEGAKFEDAEAAIRSDPLFVEEETLVFPVDDVATLEDEGQGVLMERHGTAGHTPHQLLLLEARFSELALCAQCMLAAARALPACKAGGYSLFDLPPGALWGSLRAQAERDWL
ncbi:MAG TPA: Gfo/Idh/MocA family oxidoreductase [Methylococcus sp.]|nr:Gfo/Idh/MocA family oxidoreductase [Methylococcus sp.]